MAIDVVSWVLKSFANSRINVRVGYEYDFLQVCEFNKSFYDLLKKFHDFVTGVVCDALCLLVKN